LSAYKSIFKALSAGATLITVNRRLARTLHDEYANYQQAGGAQVWKRPDISTLDTWLKCRLADVGQEGQFLNGAQADCLWQQVVRADLENHHLELMQIQATTRLVSQAHQLVVNAQCLDDSSRYRMTALCSAEHQAFLRWQSAYLSRCGQHNWIDGASLIDHVISLLNEGRVLVPEACIFIGFDEFDAGQQRLHDHLQKQGCRVEVGVIDPISQPINIEYVAAQNEREEIVAAACWARQKLEQRVGRVAVVIPDLARLQNSVERIFRHELAKSSYPDRVPVQSFNVSLGRPLAKQGMIATALMVLAVGRSVDFETISYLLRTPWLADVESEINARSRFEAQLRQQNMRQASVYSLLAMCRSKGGGCSSFIRLLNILEKEQKKTTKQSLSQWSDHFNHLLTQVGWPGERALTSDDYQALAAWREKLMPALASLSVVHGLVDRAIALRLLRKLAAEQLFQSKAQDDRLQVTGLLETAGLQYDAMWVTGLTDHVLPGRVQYNPFIPTSVQRHFQMPHSSIQHEHRYAQLTLDRLKLAAAEIVFSFSLSDGAITLSPSPFLPREVQTLQPQASNDDVTPQRSVELESLLDDIGQSLICDEQGHEVSGGTSVLKEQALCPFRAYAHHRLKIRALETPQTGIDSRVRGDLVHKILELFWTEVTSHEQLCSLSDEELMQYIALLTEQVLEQTRLNDQAKELLVIEKPRLTSLLFEWIGNIERQRHSFSVVSVEQRQQVKVGPLLLTAVPDRVDQLEDGRCVVIDYKSGVVENKSLIGESLVEPQLPIYALKSLSPHQQPIVAVVFAQIRLGECAFKGVAAEDDLLPRVKAVANSAATKRDIYDWPVLLADWDRQLNQLADDFVAAHAKVEPVAVNTCQFCDLARLCRIAESEGGN